MAGYAQVPPVTPLLLNGTSAVNFKAAVPGSVGAAKDTLVWAFHIIANATAVTVTMTGFQNSAGSAASIVWTGSTTQDIITVFPQPILNWASAFSATPSVSNMVWLYLSPYLGGPV